ncbi:alpha/beta hydrolase [Flagellimonas baculiformis]|uniref:alpha/beta hydrolase n=1 Tax=Flagellimonas baculiformis TaxID=3067310 RepID=UPI00296F85A6|nr:alpha/beta hydrolase [Muricauda sp. D6]
MTIAMSAQDTIMPLWPKAIPNQIESEEKEVVEHTDDGITWITNVQTPTLEVYLPAPKHANGQAVLIFPGGGYHGLAYDWEGTDIAKSLTVKGVAGIVIKYRLPWSKSITNGKNAVPLQDAQRAIRLVRSKAAAWGIAPDKIGIMGFSAGGHLASSLGTHYKDKVYQRQDAADDLSARPDFMALIYPVITLGHPSTHTGSRTSLLGENPTQEEVDYLSNEKHVNGDTPPVFLLHAMDDKAVPVENTTLFFEALRQHQVPATMHVYPTGGHGFSMALTDERLKNWMELLFDWLANLD